MRDQIEVRGLRLYGTHGVFAFEKEHPQPFDIDVILTADLRLSGASDSLGDTVNYGDVVKEVARIVQNEPHDLVETLAERIAAQMLAYEQVDAVEICVVKPKALLPVEVASVGVRIFRP